MSKKTDLFFQAFIGEYCEVVLDMKVPQNINIGEDGIQTIEGPLTTAGFVMDKDDMWIFLSDDGENISQAFQLKDIKHIAIVPVNQTEELDDRLLLDDDIPDDGNFN